MKETKQELKRCPFCGKNCLSPDGLYVRHSCYTIEAVAPTIDIWNNAYCWKEIDSNNKKIEALLAMLKKIEHLHSIAKDKKQFVFFIDGIINEIRNLIFKAEAQ